MLKDQTSPTYFWKSIKLSYKTKEAKRSNIIINYHVMCGHLCNRHDTLIGIMIGYCVNNTFSLLSGGPLACPTFSAAAATVCRHHCRPKLAGITPANAASEAVIYFNWVRLPNCWQRTTDSCLTDIAPPN